MPIVLAAIELSPGGLISWTVVGLLSGFLAGRFVKGSGFGLIGDIIVGLVGALVGGILVGLFTQNTTEGFWGSILVSFFGACVLLVVTRAVFGGRKG